MTEGTQSIRVPLLSLKQGFGWFAEQPRPCFKEISLHINRSRASNRAVCASTKALLRTEQRGLWEGCVDADKEMRFTDLLLPQTLAQRVRRCSAVQDAGEMKRDEFFTLNVWRSRITGRKCEFQLLRRMWMMRCNLRICFYVYVRTVCKTCRDVVQFKTQWRWRKTNLQC